MNRVNIVPKPALYPGWEDWASALARYLEERPVEQTELHPFTLATLPSARRASYHLIMVVDAPGGPKPAYSDGTNWVQIVSAAASGASGNAELNFGAFPGSYHATVAVVGQGGIGAGSSVQVQMRPVASAEHSADEHMLEGVRLFASTIVPGVGFTINGFAEGFPYEHSDRLGHRSHSVRDRLGSGSVTGAKKQIGVQPSFNIAPRAYGRFNVSWRWS